MSCPASGIFLNYDRKECFSKRDKEERKKLAVAMKKNILVFLVKGLAPHLILLLLGCVLFYLYFPFSIIPGGLGMIIIFMAPKVVDWAEAPKMRRKLAAVKQKLNVIMEKKKGRKLAEESDYRLPEKEELENLVQTGDTLASEIAVRRDLSFHDQMKELYNSVEVPEWVDWEMIERGRDAYNQYCLVLSFGLTVALVESFVFPEDAQVLKDTGGLHRNIDGIVDRLMQTGYWIWNVKREDLHPGGKGFQEALNIRFLHLRAAKISNRKEQKRRKKAGEDAPMQKISINQGNMAGTLILFCQVSTIAAELRGPTISKYDKECMWHRWRYIGHLIGIDCDTDTVPLTYEAGIAVRDSNLFISKQVPSELSRTLTVNMLDAYEAMPIVFQRRMLNLALHHFWVGPRKTFCSKVGIPSWAQIPLRSKVWYYTIFYLWRIFAGMDIIFPFMQNIQNYYHPRSIDSSYRYYFFGQYEGRKLEQLL